MPLHQLCFRQTEAHLIGHSAFEFRTKLIVAHHSPLRMLERNGFRAFGQVEPYLAHLVASLHDSKRRGESKLTRSHHFHESASLTIEIADDIDECAYIAGQLLETLDRECAVRLLLLSRETESISFENGNTRQGYHIRHTEHCLAERMQNYSYDLLTTLHIYYSRLKSEIPITSSALPTVDEGCHVRT